MPPNIRCVVGIYRLPSLIIEILIQKILEWAVIGKVCETSGYMREASIGVLAFRQHRCWTIRGICFGRKSINDWRSGNSEDGNEK